MFNIGPLELMVLAIVGLVVLGPDKLPDLARDAARLLRQLREMATGARQQLKDELGPEFADLDLSSLNPRTAVQRAVFGDELPDFGKYDPRRYDPKTVAKDVLFGAEPKNGAATEHEPDLKPVSFDKRAADGGAVDGSGSTNGSRPTTRPAPPAARPAPPQPGERPRPRPRPRPAAPPAPPTRFDDAT